VRAAFLLAAGLLALAGCARPPALPQLAPEAVVLAFGDSLTHGTGAAAAESYPAVLEALIGRRVVNAGVPGELSAAGRDRLPGLLHRHAPRLLILCHGGNDLLRRRPADETEANLREMVTAARARGVAVVLLGVPAPGLWLSPAAVYGRLADELGLPYEGEVLAEVLGDNRLKSDAIHPNREGYRRLAEAVADLLREAGALAEGS
jgi:lysophospholipase L1-like esterase